jgi:MFS family permease
MGALLITGHARIWEIFVLQAIGGAATAFYSPASSGIVLELVPAEHLQKANALMGIARYVSFPLGAAVGGSIVATIGSGTALLVDAATYAVSAALLSQIRLGARAARVATPSFVRELREGWQAFTEQTWIWLLTVWIALYSS